MQFDIGLISLKKGFGVHPDSFDTFDFAAFGPIAKGLGIQKSFDFIGYGVGSINTQADIDLKNRRELILME